MTTDDLKCMKDQNTECLPTADQQQQRACEERQLPPERLESSGQGQEQQPEAPQHHVEVQTKPEHLKPDQLGQVERKENEKQESCSKNEENGAQPEAQPGAVELEAHEAQRQQAPPSPAITTTEPRTPVQAEACTAAPEHHASPAQQPSQPVFRGPVPSPTPPPEDIASPKQSPKYPSTPGQTQMRTNVGGGNDNNNNNGNSSHLPPTPPPSAPRINEGLRSVSLGSQSSASCTSTPRIMSSSHSHIAASSTLRSEDSSQCPPSESGRSRSAGSNRSGYHYEHHHYHHPRGPMSSEPPRHQQYPDGGDLAYAASGSRLDATRLGALDKAQRFWELQNDVSTEGVPPSEKEARLEMLGRDLISDLHLLIEGSVALENILKDDRLRVWTTGAAVAAGIPTFCFLTQYPYFPRGFNASTFASSLSSLPAKTISTLHSIPAHPVSRAAGRAATQAFQTGRQAINTAARNPAAFNGSGGSSMTSRASAAAGEGLMALSAATLALSLVPTAIGAIEVAMHERKLGDVQSWTEDLRHLCKVVEEGGLVDGMDMYCLTDERWEELPWKEQEDDMRDLCY